MVELSSPHLCIGGNSKYLLNTITLESKCTMLREHKMSYSR